MNQYLKICISFCKKFKSNRNNGSEATYIVRKQEKVTAIIGLDRVSFPEIELTSAIKYQNIYYPTAIDDIITRLNADILQWDESRLTNRWYYLFQLLFPILFWLFRGVEAIFIIFILLAYMLSELGGKVNPHGKVVSVISWLFTFISGMASILSYISPLN